MDHDRQLLSLMLAHPETVPAVREQLRFETLNDAAVRALIQRVFKLADSAAAPDAAELLARTQEEELRAVVEEMIALEAAATSDPVGTCSWLLRQIEARSKVREAAEAHRNATTAATQSPSTAPPPDWNASIIALREAHRARGTLHIHRDSNGGTG